MKIILNVRWYYIVLCTLFPSLLQAQISGYGSVNTYLPDPNWNSGIHYMDENRAKVTSIQNVQCNGSPGATLILQNQTGSFQAGQSAVLIQMKGGVIGTHQNVMISTVNGSMVCVTPVSGSILNYSLSSAADRVQLIELKEFQNLTIDENAVITCHPWDDQAGTGGILAFIVAGKLTINGGVITASGKGYTPQEAGIVFASGSVGGAPAQTNNQMGKAPAPSEACLHGVGMIKASPTTFIQGSVVEVQVILEVSKIYQQERQFIMADLIKIPY